MTRKPRENLTAATAVEAAGAVFAAGSNAPAAYRYSCSVLAVAIVLAIRLALDSVLGLNAPYLLFVLGILMAARRLGRGPALLATGLSTIGAGWLFVEPRHSFHITTPFGVFGLLLFAVVGVLISLLLARKPVEPVNLSSQLITRANRTIAEWGSDTAGAGIAGAGNLIRKPHLFWLTAALVAVLIESGLFFATWRNFSENERLFFHAREVAEQTDRLASAVQDAERDQHDYLLTGKEVYRASLQDALTAIPVDLAELRRLTADDPAQQSQVGALASSVTATLAALRNDNRRPRLELFQVIARSEQLTRQICTLADSLSAGQLSLLKRRNEKMLAAKKLVIGLFSAESAVLLLLLLVGTRQIDENIRARQEAEAVRAGLAAIVNSSEDAIIGISLDGSIASWNAAAEKLYGYTATEIIGQPISLLMPPESQRETERAFLERIKQGKSLQYEETVRITREKRRIDVLISSSPIWNSHGQVTGASAIVRDMTEQKQAAQRLRDSEEQFRILANAIPQLCWMANPDGWIFWYNQRWFEYTGTTAEQMEGWRWKSVHDPEILPTVLERWNASIESGQSFDMTFPLRAFDGVYRPFLTRVVPVLDHQGKITRWFGTHTDVSEQCKNEETLRNTVLLLRTVLEKVGDGIYLKDCQSRMLLVNPAYLQTLGKNEVEVLGKSEAEILTDAASAAAVLQNDHQTIEQKTTVVFEETVVKPEGKRVYLSTKSPWLDRNGRVIGLIGVSTDITERQAAEQTLRESEQRISRKLESILSPDVDIGEIELREIINIEALQSLMNDFYEIARVPIALVDTSGKVLARAGWQEICTRFHRVHPETLKNCIESDTYLTTGIATGDFKLYKCKNNLWDAAAPVVVGGRHLGNIFTGQMLLDDEPLNIDLFSTQARKHGFDEKEYLGALETVPRMKQQNVDRVIQFLSKLGDLVGKLSYANIRLAKSIAELERVQASLGQVSEQRGLALEAAKLGTWDYRFDNGEMFLDERCREMLGIVTGDQVRREDTLAQIHPDDREASDEALKQAISGANGGSYHDEYRVVWADGSLHWVASHGRAYFEREDHNCGATRLVGVNMDITDRKVAENAVLQLNASLEARVKERTAQLQESNRELEAFSYSVSHDLRAPLRSIEGFAKILLRDYSGKPLDATAAGYMQRMSNASQRMGNLIADLLTLSRLTRIEMSRKAINVSEFARDILADCQSREPDRVVRAEIQPGLVINADPILVRVALENLLGNAWKYTSKTDAARIAFEAGVQQGEVVFCIRDNGAGFDMAHSEQLFAPFQRLHRSDEFEGNGIGLATVQRVIRRHGGRIWAESKPGEGAVFYFTLEQA